MAVRQGCWAELGADHENFSVRVGACISCCDIACTMLSHNHPDLGSGSRMKQDISEFEDGDDLVVYYISEVYVSKRSFLSSILFPIHGTELPQIQSEV